MPGLTDCRVASLPASRRNVVKGRDTDRGKSAPDAAANFRQSFILDKEKRSRSHAMLPVASLARSLAVMTQCDQKKRLQYG